MSKKKILKGIIAAVAAISIINVGSKKDVKAEAVLLTDAVKTNIAAEDNSIGVRAAKKVWVYKEENGKRYMRLYDATNQVWLTDWILCA